MCGRQISRKEKKIYIQKPYKTNEAKWNCARSFFFRLSSMSLLLLYVLVLSSSTVEIQLQPSNWLNISTIHSENKNDGELSRNLKPWNDYFFWGFWYIVLAYGYGTNFPYVSSVFVVIVCVCNVFNAVTLLTIVQWNWCKHKNGMKNY